MSYYYPGSESGVFSWAAGHAVKSANGRAVDYMLSEGERERLDILLGAALVDADLRQRLLGERDASLFMAYALSEETLVWLQGLNATSLTELAQAIAYHS